MRIGKGYFQTEGGVEDWKGVFSDLRVVVRNGKGYFWSKWGGD